MRHKALCLLLVPLLLATACSRLTFVRPKMERKDGEQIAQDYSVKDSPEVKRRQSVQMMEDFAALAADPCGSGVLASVALSERTQGLVDGVLAGLEVMG